jgi:hypothetical protein
MLLNKELNEFEQFIAKYDQQNQSVSAVNIAWHIDHSLKVINGVCGMLKKSKPSDYQWKFNHIQLIVFTLNFFPRGKAKSPKAVLPPDDISKEDLRTQLKKAKEELNSITNLPAKSHFKHPYFGSLNLKRTKKFLRLHTVHHLKICRDIVK